MMRTQAKASCELQTKFQVQVERVRQPARRAASPPARQQRRSGNRELGIDISREHYARTHARTRTLEPVCYPTPDSRSCLTQIPRIRHSTFDIRIPASRAHGICTHTVPCDTEQARSITVLRRIHSTVHITRTPLSLPLRPHLRTPHQPPTPRPHSSQSPRSAFFPPSHAPP